MGSLAFKSSHWQVFTAFSTFPFALGYLGLEVRCSNSQPVEKFLIIKSRTVVADQHFRNTMAGKPHLRLSNDSSCCLPVDLHCFKEIRPVVHHYQECLVPDDKQIRGDLARRKVMWFKILSSLCWAICLADCAMRHKVSYFSTHSWPMQNFTSTGEPILQCQ